MIKKILVSQPRPTSDKSPYFDIAERFGLELVFRPFIKVVGLSPREFRTQKVNILDYTAVVFTSRHAIDHFFTLAHDLRVTIPEDMKYSVSLKPLPSIFRSTCNIASARCSLALPDVSTTCSLP